MSKIERKRRYLPVLNKNRRRFMNNFENYVMNYQVYEENLGERKIYWKITKPMDTNIDYMGTFSVSLYRKERYQERSSFDY
jgi:hypothetical protein